MHGTRTQTNRPTKSHTPSLWVVLATNLLTFVTNGTTATFLARSKWWDWGWAIKEAGLSNMQYATGGSLRPFHSFVSGDFYAESQYAGTIEIGQAKPLKYRWPKRSRSAIEGENQTTEQILVILM